MPPKHRRAKAAGITTNNLCQHKSILVDPSQHASDAGYTRATSSQRAKAQGVKIETFEDAPYTFPAPLVLPEDDLALDPKHPGQSLLSWTREKHRNRVTDRQRTIYIAVPPLFDVDVSFAKTWATPCCSSSESASTNSHPGIEEVADYVRAFYHPLPVKIMPTPFSFMSWSATDLTKLKQGKPMPDSENTAMIGLQTMTEVVGVRTRATPTGDFVRQLNLDDLLDAAIASLPGDAYAFLMLVDQDLYEDDDDEFVCGRAYGGSRVAVVSTARYNPVLDTELGLDVNHVWPSSHCTQFVDGFRARKRKFNSDHNEISEDSTTSPLCAAVSAAKESQMSTLDTATSLWLGRVCRTASHELGHCFGIGHCVYYACCMQGSASLKEDSRQPPYLCPIDLAKVLKATGTSEKEHIIAMLEFCGRHKNAELFSAYAAWLQQRLVDIQSNVESISPKSHDAKSF